jgi:hypothetical protein
VWSAAVQGVVPVLVRELVLVPPLVPVLVPVLTKVVAPQGVWVRVHHMVVERAVTRPRRRLRQGVV